jgi:D-3-phosphoglycerate dehydrogenase
MRILVTATNYSKYCGTGKKILESAGCQIIENDKGRPYRPEELKKLVSDIDGAVVGVDTWDDDIFSVAKELKVVARFGVGVDNIDLEAAKKHNIVVCNTPGINSSAVSEQAIALMLSLIRQVPELAQDVRLGKWTRPMFHELKSRTVGLLGFGAIARNVAQRLQGFEPKIIAYDKYPNEEAAKRLNVEFVSQDELLKYSDIISIHLPATTETEHLINQSTISQMKNGVLLVNTARGSIVNETDVEKALTSGKIGGFATDVFEKEPVDPNAPLFTHRNYIATPHVSAETYENCEATSVATTHEILDVLNGRAPEHRIV